MCVSVCVCLCLFLRVVPRVTEGEVLRHTLIFLHNKQASISRGRLNTTSTQQTISIFFFQFFSHRLLKLSGAIIWRGTKKLTARTFPPPWDIPINFLESEQRADDIFFVFLGFFLSNVLLFKFANVPDKCIMAWMVFVPENSSLCSWQRSLLEIFEFLAPWVIKGVDAERAVWVYGGTCPMRGERVRNGCFILRG